MKPIRGAAAIPFLLVPVIAFAGPAPTVESLQKEIATLRAQNTICSADLSRVMQDRVALVESLANSNTELEKTKAALAAATAKPTPTAPPTVPPKAGAVFKSNSTSSTSPSFGAPEDGARR